MPILAEIQMGNAETWVDDSIAAWVDDSIAAWADGDETTLYLSDQNFASSIFWAGYILDYDSPAYAQDYEYGGMIKANAGSITISLDAFITAMWPPAREITIVVYYTETTDSAKTHVFSGAGFLSSLNYPESITYQLYAPPSGKSLLEEAVDYNGNTVALPRAFGSVVHGESVRLPNYIYPGEGTLGVYALYSGGHLQADGNQRVYDDGIDITGNVKGVIMDTDATYPGIKAFILEVEPVGTVTISGNGVTSDIDSLFTWAIAAERLNLTANWTTFTGHRIDKYATEQADILDFLSGAAAACAFNFYIAYQNTNMGTGSTLTLVDMRVTSTTAMTKDIPAEALVGTEITALSPKSQATHSWDVGYSQEVNLSYQVAREKKSITVVSDYPFGDPMQADVYTTNEDEIKKRLRAILDIWHQPRIELKLPLTGTLPIPGQQITITDNRHSADLSGAFFAREIAYDFIGRSITVSGEGGIA